MIRILGFILCFFLGNPLWANCTVAVTIQDSIGAATYDILQRAGEKAKERKCQAVFLRINTPGGSLQSTRLITEHILASEYPYLCLISPAGGHAGSAGAIILQACHVSGGLPATNLGAATPVASGGQEIPEDLRKKLINDTVSWLEGMTELRGRNQEFSRKIITEGQAVTTETAVRMKALDIAATTETEFLDKAVGRKYRDAERVEKEIPAVGQLIEMPQDLRFKVLQFISEPEWAYLFFLGALLLLYAEFSNPGLFVPGVTGAILLILALIAFHKLEANYGAIALMILGLAFWIAELFVASKGVLGIAGTMAFLIGSFLLFDPESSGGVEVPKRLILMAGLLFGGVSAVITTMAARTLHAPKHDYDDQMKHSRIHLLEINPDGRSGKIEVLGEIWNFESNEVINLEDEVVFKERKHFTIMIEKKK